MLDYYDSLKNGTRYLSTTVFNYFRMKQIYETRIVFGKTKYFLIKAVVLITNELPFICNGDNEVRD